VETTNCQKLTGCKRVAFCPSTPLPEATVQRRVPMLVLLLVSVVFSASAQIRNQRQPPVRSVDGASIFRNYCAACHGLDGRGNGPVSKALKREVPDLTRLSQRNDGAFPAVHVRTTIMFGADDLLSAHGSKEMPIWGPIFHEIEFDQDLGNVRLENISKYLESIQRK
jgi:mono/diheme cytochrome c family protein